MAGDVGAMRSEADIPQYWPRWFIRFALKLAHLERGHAYDVTLIMPEGDGEPVWIVRNGGKVENSK